MALVKNIGAIHSTNNTLLDLSTVFPAGTGVNNTLPVEPVTPAPVPPVETVTVPNVAAIAEPASSKSILLFAGLGVGAWLLLRKKRAAVSGAENKKSMLPLLLIGGAAAWWLYSQRSSSTYNVAPNQQPNTGANLPALNPTGTAPASPVTAITADPVNVAAARGFTAQSDLAALQRDYPTLNAIYPLMTDAEIISVYNYVYGYMLQGLKLYSGPGATGTYPDGNWNTVLYNQIAIIKEKYNIKF